MEHSRLIDFITKSTIVKKEMIIDNKKEEKEEEKEEVKEEHVKDDIKINENSTEHKKKNIKKDKKLNNNNNNNSNSNNNNRNIIKKIVVADMMAGVGPFGIPLAMNNISVYANDLNPASYRYLNTNMRINHCEKFLKTFNMCGR